MNRIGIVGTSWISKDFSKSAAASGKFEVVAVVTRSLENADYFIETFPGCQIFPDVQSLVSTSLIHAIYIASPNSFHYFHAKLALEHGKHVICEKPVAENVARLDELTEIAKKNGVVIFEAYKTAFLPQLKNLKEGIEKIGCIRSVFFNFCQRSSKLESLMVGELPNVFSPKYSGGSLVDIGFYGLSLAIELFGEPVSSTGISNLLTTGVDGSGMVVMRYIDFDVIIRHAKTFQSDVDSEISGDLGSIIIKSISNLGAITYRSPNGIVTTNHPPSGNMRYEIEKFCALLEGEDTSCADLIRSRGVLSIMEKVRLSSGVVFPSDHYS